MSPKFHVGDELTLKNGDVVRVVNVSRSIHGNTSLIGLADAASGKAWPRSVRTAWLTQATKDGDTCATHG